MSGHAIYRNLDTGEEKYILARNCSAADYGLPFFCPSCDASMTLRKSRKGNYFFGGTHNEGCDIASVSKGKTIILPTGFQIPIDAILSAEDRPIRPPHPGGPNGGGGGGGRGGGNEPEDEYLYFREGPLALRDAGAMLRNLRGLPKDEPINLDGSLTVGDLLIDESNFGFCKLHGIDGKTRLVVVQRINPKNLDPSLPRIGFLVFRDAYSKSDADALYFLVKITEPSQHQHFYDLVAGPPELRSKHRRIALFAKWTRLPNCSLNAYYAEINSRCYHFFD